MTRIPPPPPPPKPFDDTPRMMVQRVGMRESGYHAWEAWVAVGPMRYHREYGTYAWTRERAERKARRLLKRYLRSRRGPAEEITR